MKRFISSLFTIVIFIALSVTAQAQDEQSLILITNANVFDGENERLQRGVDVLVEGNLIKEIAADIQAPAGAQIIDARGRTLMPGLIDAHWHSMLAFWPISRVLSSDIATLSLAAAQSQKAVLMRGFTTVRDAGGAAIPIAKAIDSGLIEGPRMYAPGPVIGQTSGHGDWRNPLTIPEDDNAPLDYPQKTGQTLIADGVPEVMKRGREALRMGATHLKAMGGGGVNSLYDPLDVVQYTPEEAKALCDVAAQWNTYVMVHAHNDAAARQWVEAGAMTVEHGFFIEEETAKLMAKKGVWWSMQAMEATGPDAFVFENPESNAKWLKAVAGIDNVVALAKKHKVNIAWGTDLQFDPSLLPKQGKFLTKMSKWFTPYEALKIRNARQRPDARVERPA